MLSSNDALSDPVFISDVAFSGFSPDPTPTALPRMLIATNASRNNKERVIVNLTYTKCSLQNNSLIEVPHRIPAFDPVSPNPSISCNQLRGGLNIKRLILVMPL